MTILYVSHEFGAVEHVVSRLLLVRGRIVFDGAPPSCPRSGTTPPTLTDARARVHAARLRRRRGRRRPRARRSASSSSSDSQSLVGDGLGHVAFAGVAAGYLLGISPVLTALCFAVVGALAIEWLRSRGGTAGDQALALVFYTGIALGIVLISSANRLDVGLFQFLFGSILTVTRDDLWVVLALGVVSLATIAFLYRGLVGVVLDEEGSRVAGVHVGAAQHRGRRARGADGRHLDADRRDPPDRGVDGAPGDRRATDRVEPPLDARALDGDRPRRPCSPA